MDETARPIQPDPDMLDEYDCNMGVLCRYAQHYAAGTNLLIGDVDTLVAATALEHGLTVVTTDTDYQRVPGLSLQLLRRHP